MLNIISRSIQDKKTRGPKKVVDNLILGLEKIGYPYVINKDLNSCTRLWIQDDIDALYDLKKLDPEIKVIVGPNLFVNPENIPSSIDLSKTIYVQPCANVKHIWEKQNYKQSPLEVWPIGIDTEKYIPFEGRKDIVLVYFKNREPEALLEVEKILKEKNITSQTIVYGKYTQDEYKTLLKRTRYIVWLGIYESQGIALEEALACNIPILVLDTQKRKTADGDATSAPYFDERCGIIVKNNTDITNAVDTMEIEYTGFSPRKFILENLELKSQAEKFIDLYDTYYGLKREDGLHETCDNAKDYKVSMFKRLYHKIYGKLFYR